MIKDLLKKTEFKQPEQRDSEYIHIHKDVLMDILSQAVEGKIVKISNDTIGCEDIVYKWNQLMDVYSGHMRRSIMDVNDLLKIVIGMDSIKDMIKSVHQQVESLHSMTVSSEQMTASIEDVANMTQKVTEGSNRAYEIAEIGIKNITEAMDFVRDSFEQMGAVTEQIQSVKEKTNVINDIINIVKGIADQTNLLALNAAIEAARAGDQGRGFAVVAEEVKKLADHTKESVSNIQKNIGELLKDMDLVVENVNVTSSRLNSGRVLVDTALESLHQIGSAIEEVNEAVTQVASNVQEQTAVTQTVTNHIQDISKEADYLNNSCEITGKEIYALSNRIDSIRKELLNFKMCLTDIDMVDIYKTDNLHWRWRVYNMLLGYQKMDSDEVGDVKRSRFSRWYYDKAPEDIRNTRIYKELEQPNLEMHEAAKKAIVAFENGDIEKAEEALKKMDECSVKINSLLDELKTMLR